MTSRVRRSALPQLWLFTLLAFVAVARPAAASTIYGLTVNNGLITFDSATPGTISTIGPISGLQAGEFVLGIDFRPATGGLYGLGSNSNLYLINPLTATATQVGSSGAFILSGTAFGFDHKCAIWGSP